jgi:hypothetical protein
MKLSNTISQNISLQLSTSLALETGMEEIHELVKMHENNLLDSKFINEVKSFLIKANKKGFFNGNLPDEYFLKEDKGMLGKTILYAAQRHYGEYRESGHPYLSHVLGTGFILARLGLPKDIILAGILHDTVEGIPDKKKVLNDLYAMKPAIAYYVYSVSGPDIKDAVAKDKVLYARIQTFSDHAGNNFPKVIKCADSIANLYDIEYMRSKDGRTARERQLLFLAKAEETALAFAAEIDASELIPLKKKKGEIFSLQEFVRESIGQKLPPE